MMLALGESPLPLPSWFVKESLRVKFSILGNSGAFMFIHNSGAFDINYEKRSEHFLMSNHNVMSGHDVMGGDCNFPF
jgi:hypothetical protein